MHPIDIIEHYRFKTLFKEFNGEIFPPAQILKKDWMEKNAERYQKQFTVFGAMSRYNVNDIVKLENITLYCCPVIKCNFTSDRLASIKKHVSTKHITKEEKRLYYKRRREQQNFITTNGLRQRI